MTVDSALLALKVAFLVLLYLFIWRIVRAMGRELKAPSQESVVIGPAAAADLRAAAGGGAVGTASGPAWLVVVESPVFEAGERFGIDTHPITIGRGSQNDLELEGDEFASSRHARLSRRPDGVWIEDLGSTNGTYVNGEQVEGSQRLEPGDEIHIGESDFELQR